MNTFLKYGNIETISAILGLPTSVPDSNANESESHDIVYHFENAADISIDADNPKPKHSRSKAIDQIQFEASTSDTLIKPQICSPFNTDMIPDPLGWPKEAVLRLLYLITANNIYIVDGLSNMFFNSLSYKMAWIRSDEPFVSESILDESEIERYRNHPKSSGPIYLKPAYSIRPTPSEIKEKLSQFYNLDRIAATRKPRIKVDGGMGSYVFKRPRSAKQTVALSRSRRTGLPNRIVEAIVEEKKHAKRLNA